MPEPIASTDLLRPGQLCPRLVPHRERCTGLGAVELVVALTLLTTALTVGTQLVVRAKGVLDDHRDYRLALDEVSNVLEALTALPQEDLNQQLEAVQISSAIASHLENAVLSVSSKKEKLGTRITLQMDWGLPGQKPKTVVLSGWHIESPVTDQADDTNAGDVR